MDYLILHSFNMICKHVHSMKYQKSTLTKIISLKEQQELKTGLYTNLHGWKMIYWSGILNSKTKVKHW
jgi:hypothetical protein